MMCRRFPLSAALLPCVLLLLVPAPSGRAAYVESEVLLASGAEPGDEGGASSALAGPTAVVGAPRARGGRGVATVFRQDGGVWSEEDVLLAPDAAEDDEFGVAVAVSGGTAVAGAWRDDDHGTEAGAAYVFVRSSGRWVLEQKLLAPDGSAHDRFGTSVGIDGDRIVVGAPRDDDDGAGSGAVYVFERREAVWGAATKVRAPDAAAGDAYGSAVALGGGRLAVGAPLSDGASANGGAAYVHVLETGSWRVEARLLGAAIARGDRLGNALAFDGDTLVAGVRYGNAAGTDAGSAYVFERHGATWTETAHLVSRQAASGDEAGASVGLSGSWVVVGAPFAGARAGGRAVFFQRGVSGWCEVEHGRSAEADAGAAFGTAVALDGPLGLVGAPGSDAARGAAHVLVLDDRPPVVTVGVRRSLLWPPRRGMVPVGLHWTLEDERNEGATVEVRVYSNEAPARPPAAWSAAGAPETLRLRAERAWPGPGRIYVVVLEVTGLCSGTLSWASASVVVPAVPTFAALTALRARAAAAEAERVPAGLTRVE